MKRTTALFLTFALLLILCGCSTTTEDALTEPTESEYMIITKIDHCVVESDDELHMTKEDKAYYKNLMESMLSHANNVTLSNNSDKNEYYIDLLKQSPYFFFVNEYQLDSNTVHFSYVYSENEQNEILKFMDDRFLKIINTNASEKDNTLDKILNVHGAVARSMSYDHARNDNKQLDSELFRYPSDEIYMALITGKSLCYGFAYTLRFLLLQIGVDCFCVYGPCRDQGEAHMWNIFKYDDQFYTCDSAWDRSEGEYAQLNHFGKTDKEREVDKLTRIGFSSTFFEEYGEINCTDEKFKIFRSINRYTYVSPHTYYLEDYDSNEFIFDTETFELK